MSMEGPVKASKHARMELAFFLSYRFLSLLVRVDCICGVSLLLCLLLLVSTAA